MQLLGARWVDNGIYTATPHWPGLQWWADRGMRGGNALGVSGHVLQGLRPQWTEPRAKVTITVVPGDGETLLIETGIGLDVTYEYDTVPDGVAGGNRQLDISAAATPEDVVDLLVADYNTFAQNEQPPIPVFAVKTTAPGVNPASFDLIITIPWLSNNMGGTARDALLIASSTLDVVVEGTRTGTRFPGEVLLRNSHHAMVCPNSAAAVVSPPFPASANVNPIFGWVLPGHVGGARVARAFTWPVANRVAA